MAPPRRAPTPRRDPVAERDRRERARRERLRQRGQVQPAPRTASAVVTRERHEGLVGVILRWIVAVPVIVGAAPRTIKAAPSLLGGVLRGFLHEVGAVVLGAVRAVVGLLPATGRLAGPARGARRAAARSSAAGRGPSAGTSRSGGSGSGTAPPARRPRTAAQARAAMERRARVRTRLRIAAAAVLLSAAVGAWIVVPASDVFRIRHLEVTGTSAVGDLDVRDRIDPLLTGRTVFTVDEDALARRIEELPFVRDVRVERHLPGGLQLHVSEYRPLALGYASGAGGDAGDFWLVAHDGRILAEANPEEWTGRIPTVELREERIRPGDRVGGEASLQLLAARARDSAVAFDVVRSDRFTISARLVDGIDVRFGRPTQLLLKVAVLERALELADRNGEELRYVDVSVPGKPAICPLSDVRCSQRRTPAADAGSDGAASGATTPEETGGDEATDADAVG